MLALRPVSLIHWRCAEPTAFGLLGGFLVAIREGVSGSGRLGRPSLTLRHKPSGVWRRMPTCSLLAQPLLKMAKLNPGE